MAKKGIQERPLKAKDTNSKNINGKAAGAKVVGGKDTDGKVTVGRNSNGRNTNGRNTNGKNTSGKDTSTRPINGKQNGKTNNAKGLKPDSSLHPKFFKVFPFLKLPAELRIKIYNYSFGKHVLEILPVGKGNGLTSWNLKSKKPKPSLRNSESLATRGRSSKPGHADKRLSKWPKIESKPGLAALLLTCKQIHRETHHLLYEQVTFIICSQTVFQRFLTNLSPPCLATIRSLKLQHHTHGEPYLNENRVWKQQYESKWAALCLEAGDKMTGLKELEVKLAINDWPTELNLQALWALPLLAFADGQLEKVKVHLEMNGRCVEWQKLRACAAVLERELVVQKNRLDVGGMNGEQPKAVRCLRIT